MLLVAQTDAEPYVFSMGFIVFVTEDRDITGVPHDKNSVIRCDRMNREIG
ncbi:TPA: hypothetical protein ACNH0U_000733 [Proteus mirabilis]